MEEHLIESLVEAISYGYEEELNEISRQFEISHKRNNLNFAKIKRNDNLKKWLDNQDSERFIFINKQSFLFIDTLSRRLYAFMTEEYKNQLVYDFKKNTKLTYLTALILLKNSSKEEIEDQKGTLFDVTPYVVDSYEDETYEEASEKAKNILESYGDYIDKVCIITREKTLVDTPRIMMHEFSKDFEIITVEDWSKYLPAIYNNNFENDKKKKKEKRKKRQNKYTKLRKEEDDENLE